MSEQSDEQARLIDWSRQHWGHALHPVGPVVDGVLRGTCHVTPGPRVGDRCRWEVEQGHVIAVLDNVESFRDPSDMYRIVARIVERVPHARPDGATGRG